MELELRLPALSAAVLMLAMTGASALTPFPKPEPTDAVPNGTAAPFVGNWEIVAPTMTMGEPDQNLAICSLPVRIEAVDDRTLIYRQPGETRTGQTMTLTGVEGGTLWTPGDGSDADFTFWVSPEGFYLYDDLPEEEADWGFPYIFRRCP